MDSLKGMYNVAFVKLFISLLFTILLNHLCQRGLGIISWIIVFIPFMLMSLITALLLVLFGIDAQTGKLKLESEEAEPVKELDAREKAIANYSMNRSKDDYLKRLEEMGHKSKDFFFLKLKSKGAQRVINPAYNNLYDSVESDSKYELVKSGKARNRMKTRLLAEELYFLIHKKIKNTEIKIERDLGGKVKNMFINNCDVAIDYIFEDLHYRLNNIYGVYDLNDDEHEEAIAKALKDIKNWGVLRNINGETVLSDKVNLNTFREYTDNMVSTDPEWLSKIMERYKSKINSRFETRCNKIQIKLNNYQREKNIDFGNILSNNGESAYTNILDDAYSKKSATNVEQPESSSQPKMPDIPIVTPQETNDCAAHHGTTTPSDGSDSGKVDAKYVCPQSKPVCKGYKFNVNWGKCVEESGNNDDECERNDPSKVKGATINADGTNPWDGTKSQEWNINNQKQLCEGKGMCFKHWEADGKQGPWCYEKSSSTQQSEKFKKLGCYNDNEERALPKRFTGNFTVESCMNKAKENNYKYFGLQYPQSEGSQCFASNNLQEAQKYGKTDCGETGGTWKNYLYEINNVNSAPSAPAAPAAPSDLCSRKVTAERLEVNPGTGWGMNLRFKCDDTEVNIGNSPGNNSKTSAESYNLSSNSCPTRVDKNNWSGRHPSTGTQYGDKFDITVSDCISSTAATAAPAPAAPAPAAPAPAPAPPAEPSPPAASQFASTNQSCAIQ